MKTFVFMFVRGLRAAFYTLDKAVFFLFESAYSLVQKIAEVNILGEGDFQDFASRVYLFLGIFMLFKVAVSLINYFINPDSFSDSKSGMGSVLKRIIISLILIVAVPFIFTEARTLQDLLIKNENGNILVNVVFGGNGSGDTQNMEEYYSNAGSTMSVKIFCSFFKAKDGDNEACLSAESISALENLIDETGADEHEFTYDYKIPLSTIAGGFAAWIMVMFCFDVAVRAVKLSFLQLISPIPVMSYIDPKKGDQIFNKWVSECVSTYLSLFLRLLALYLGIYILSRINIDSTDTFATVFIILGLLLFMKEVPKLVMDIFGIKDMGGFTLNPLRKIQQVPGIGWAGHQLVGRTASAYEAARHDQTNRPVASAIKGWFGAGDSLRGKVKFGGNDTNASYVHSAELGMKTGYELSTGTTWKPHSFINDFFQPGAEAELNAIKAREKVLNSYISELEKKKSGAQHSYDRAYQGAQSAKTDGEKAKYNEIMDKSSAQVDSFNSSIAKIQKDLSILSDQKKDLTRIYTIDQSSNRDLRVVEEHMSNPQEAYGLTPNITIENNVQTEVKPSVENKVNFITADSSNASDGLTVGLKSETNVNSQNSSGLNIGFGNKK